MHVFFSYNRKDDALVTRIEGFLAPELRGHALEPWRDVWELRPGFAWQPEVVQALHGSSAVLVFVGPHALGPAQEREVQQALSQQMARSIPVIPVLLPGAVDVRELLSFIDQNTWIDFRQGVPERPEERVDFAVELARLVFGITADRERLKEVRDRYLRRPAARRPVASPPSGDAEAAVEKAVDDLEVYLRDENITLFVGTGAAPCRRDEAPGGRPRAPAVRQLPGALLRELRLIPRLLRRSPPAAEAAAGQAVAVEDRRRRHVWLLPGIDVAGEYYIARNNPRRLEDRLRDHLPHSVRGTSPAYRQIAVLLALLARRATERGQTRPRQLVVSTNYDVLLECALVLAGVPFTRVVQYRTGRQVQVDRYRALPGSPAARLAPAELRRAVLGAFDTADDAREGGPAAWLEQAREGGERIRLGSAPGKVDFGDDAGVLLYKLVGSMDVPDSCAISTDQLFTLTVEQQKSPYIPEQLLETVADTPALFLGFWPLDPDLRLAFHLFRGQLELKEKERILLPYWPRGREATMRLDLKEKTGSRLGGLRVLDDRCERFLERLVERAVEVV